MHLWSTIIIYIYINSKHFIWSLPIKFIIKASPPYSASLGGNIYDSIVDKPKMRAKIRSQWMFFNCKLLVVTIDKVSWLALDKAWRICSSNNSKKNCIFMHLYALVAWVLWVHKPDLSSLSFFKLCVYFFLSISFSGTFIVPCSTGSVTVWCIGIARAKWVRWEVWFCAWRHHSWCQVLLSLVSSITAPTGAHPNYVVSFLQRLPFLVIFFLCLLFLLDIVVFTMALSLSCHVDFVFIFDGEVFLQFCLYLMAK